MNLRLVDAEFLKLCKRRGLLACILAMSVGAVPDVILLALFWTADAYLGELRA